MLYVIGWFPGKGRKKLYCRLMDEQIKNRKVEHILCLKGWQRTASVPEQKEKQ